jgi:feruloyl esterase
MPICAGSMLSGVWRETRECALKHGISRTFVRPGTVRFGKGLVSARRNHGFAQFFRLFLVPGVDHGGGGPGFTGFDSMTALEKWVEKGQAPEKLIASRLSNGVVERSRPVYPYTVLARYYGTGDPKQSDSFAPFDPARH